MRIILVLAIALNLLSLTSAQETAVRFRPGRPGPVKPVKDLAVAPVFAVAEAGAGRGEFGLDGPHSLTLVTLTSSELVWKAKEKTEKWRFAQPEPAALNTVSIYLNGPSWHQAKQSQIVRADGRELGKPIEELLETPTPVLISLTGKPVSEIYLKLVKPETLIVLLGARDLELLPIRIDSVSNKPSNVATSPAQPAANEKGAPPTTSLPKK